MFKLDSKIVKTKAWLKDSYEKFQDTDLVPNGILSLIGNASTFPETLPETLSLDKSRLVSYYNDWQDITILACILVIFKGCAGPKCTPMNLIEIKDNIWVLLNDNETTMDHITLQLQHEAGKVRGADLSATERKSLSNLVDTSLAPDSPLYKLIQSRVRIHLLTVASGNVPSGLEKHGLGHVEEKIQLLGGHVKHVLEMNLQIYARLYAVILEDLKSQLNGGIGASDLDIINTAEAK